MFNFLDVLAAGIVLLCAFAYSVQLESVLQKKLFSSVPVQWVTLDVRYIIKQAWVFHYIFTDVMQTQAVHELLKLY